MKTILTKPKNATSLVYEVIIHIIIIAIIFGLFFGAATQKAGARAVKQQVLEKELALLVDSGTSGMSFSVNKINMKGQIQNIEIKDGKIFAYVDGLTYSKGYPYFTKYNVQVTSDTTKFTITLS